jgi:plasmid stabilization system protein ParE
MARAVVLSLVAENDLEKLLDYLYDNWGPQACDKFLTRFEEFCELVSLSPEIYPLVSKMHMLRKCVLTRQNNIYYRTKSDTIEIVTIFDNRQHPGKLKKLID